MESDELARMRSEYSMSGLAEDTAGDDPIALFERWLEESVAAKVHEPNAMALATASDEGIPSVRIVLLKGLSSEGAVFFTNYESRKGHELDANAHASAVMLWHPLQRQVRIEGRVERLSARASDDYFGSRPHGSQIGALASPQSRVVADRAELEALFSEAEAAYPDDVSRPDSWGGFRIRLDRVEFWQGRANRLHDRLAYTADDGRWVRERLAP